MWNLRSMLVKRVSTYVLHLALFHAQGKVALENAFLCVGGPSSQPSAQRLGDEDHQHSTFERRFLLTQKPCQKTTTAPKKATLRVLRMLRISKLLPTGMNAPQLSTLWTLTSTCSEAFTPMVSSALLPFSRYSSLLNGTALEFD